jgi:hypothetical protein
VPTNAAACAKALASVADESCIGSATHYRECWKTQHVRHHAPLQLAAVLLLQLWKLRSGFRAHAALTSAIQLPLWQVPPPTPYSVQWISLPFVSASCAHRTSRFRDMLASRCNTAICKPQQHLNKTTAHATNVKQAVCSDFSHELQVDAKILQLARKLPQSILQVRLPELR